MHWQKSTIVGIFLAVAFVVSEMAQTAFEAIASAQGAEAAPYIGVFAAGLIAFLIHPIQRAAERLSSKSLPNAKPTAMITRNEAFDLYRNQAEFAYPAGMPSAKDREHLDLLQHRLDLPREEVARSERHAARGFGTYVGFSHPQSARPSQSREPRA